MSHAGEPSAKLPVLLVVEENDSVRRMLDMALRQYHFAVILAADGPEAIAQFKKQGEEMDLVLLDVGMSPLSGPETLSALKQINPHVRCCFMTGDASSQCSEALLAQGALHIFRKPFSSIADLAETLHRLLAPAT